MVKRQPNVNLVTLAQQQGGFTTSERTGELNPPGTFASYQDQEQMVEGTLRSTDVQRFREQHAETLQEPGAYLGGYREPEGIRQKTPQRAGDETYLDVSKRFVDEPFSMSRKGRALDFARGQGQVSIYDTDEGLSYVHENPAVPEDRKYDYSAEMAGSVRSQKEARSLAPGPERSSRVEEMVDAIFRAQSLKRQP